MVKRIIILLFVFSSAYGQANRFAGFGSRATGGCPSTNYLADAQKFIDSSGITKASEIAAIQQLVKSLQDSCVWNSLYAVYPFVGSTAASCKWNLKDVRDVDAAYRLTFSGGVSFDSIGMLGNGINGYANTHYNPPNTIVGANNFSFGAYLALNIQEDKSSMGNFNSSIRGFSFSARVTTNTLATDCGDMGFQTTTNTDSRGLYVLTRQSAILGKCFKNGTLQTTTTATAATDCTDAMLIGCRNNLGSPGFFNTNKTGFAFIGLGLSDTDANNLNTIFQTFKTATGK